MKLEEFLVKAKANTYANVKEDGKTILPDGTREFVYEEGEFRYVDRYNGYRSFIGREVVSRNGEEIWEMKYSGEVSGIIPFTKRIYKFLREALKQFPVDTPIRGPEIFGSGNFKYVNGSEGSVKKFFGRERILHKGKSVFELEYEGGIIGNERS